MMAIFNGTYSLRFSSEWLIKRYGTVKNFKGDRASNALSKKNLKRDTFIHSVNYP
jgi:hypothetical protein